MIVASRTRAVEQRPSPESRQPADDARLENRPAAPGRLCLHKSKNRVVDAILCAP